MDGAIGAVARASIAIDRGRVMMMMMHDDCDGGALICGWC